MVWPPCIIVGGETAGAVFELLHGESFKEHLDDLEKRYMAARAIGMRTKEHILGGHCGSETQEGSF